MITINYDLSALSPRRTVTHKAIPAIDERATSWNTCIKCIDSFDLLAETSDSVEQSCTILRECSRANCKAREIKKHVYERRVPR